MLLPYPEPEKMDGLDFVGQVFCKGETRPGKLCCHQLGIVIKYKGVPMVSVGIKNIAFQLETQAELMQRKKWKAVKLHIEELNYDDIKRYVHLLSIHTFLSIGPFQHLCR